MMDNLVAFIGDTTKDIDPDIILRICEGGFPGGVIVIGYNEAGMLEFRTSFAEGRDFLWALENAKFNFLAERGQ